MSLTSFRLVSDLGDQVGVARWDRDGFACDRVLLDYAEIVVGLGETVGYEGEAGALAATTSPDHPVALLLTLIRAGRVIDCRMTLSLPGEQD